MTAASTIPYVCPLHYGEERQVYVSGIPGINYLPVVPVFGSKSPTTRIPNGTFIRFIQWKQIGNDLDSIVWEAELADVHRANETERFYISPNALDNNWLWKAKRVGKGAGRHRGW